MIILDRIIVTFLAALLFLLPWQTAYIVDSVRNSTQYGVVSFTLLDGVVALLCIVFVIRTAMGRVYKTSAWRKTSILSAMLLVLFALLSTRWSSEPLIAFLGSVRLGEALIVCGLLIYYRAHSTMFMASLMVSATLQSGIALWQFFLQVSPASSWLGMSYHSGQQLGDAVVEVFDQRWLRAYGSMPHPNILAAFVSCALFAASSLVNRIPTKRIFFIFLAGWIICNAGLFFTFSREVWLGTLVGIAVLFVVRRPRFVSFHRITPPMMLGLTTVVIWISLSVAYWEPLSARLGVGGWQRLEQKSINERLASFNDGFSLIKQSPLLGVGMHQSTFALKERSYPQPPHNIFLLVASEIGTIGLALFLALMCSVIVCVRRAQNTRMPIFLGAFCMIGIAGLFDHFFWSVQSGMFLWWIPFAFWHVDDTLEAEP